MKADWLKDGDYIPLYTKVLIGCCDCGLVHWMDFKSVKGNPFWRVRVAKRMTAKMRKRFFSKIKKG